MSTSIAVSTLEKFTTFGDLLRYLRRRAGLTQLELSIAVGYSDAQISRLEQNLRPPDLPTLEARFVPALGLEEETQTVARLLDLASQVRREDAPAMGLCPYKGLNFFDEADAEFFFGREDLTARLVERVMFFGAGKGGMQGRFLAVVGASGSGKSSLVRAGLVPALHWNKASADWHIHVLTPTAHPLESLATILAGTVAETAALMDDLARDPRSLHLFAKRGLKLGQKARLLLVIDQFEELFALCRSGEERSAFIENLMLAAQETQGPTLVLITLRADFYAQCASYPALREALGEQQEYIGAMSDAELRRAIEEPAQHGRWEFEPGLVELLLHDVGHEPGALPLLSHALLETWQRRRGRTLTLSGYASSGGVRGAIAETAEAVFTDQFTHEERIIARRIFLRLTELGDESGVADTRRRASLNELGLKADEPTVTRAVLTALADARLITVNEDAVEVAHEALIREWPTLRGWLEDNREGLRLHRQLTESAQEWLRMERDPDVLYRGTRLAQTGEWAAEHREDLNPLEQEFLTASNELSERVAAEHRAQQQRELEAAQKLAQTEQARAEEGMRSVRRLRRRAWYLGGALALAVLAMLAAGLFADRNGALARENADVAATAQVAKGAAINAQATAEAARLTAEYQRRLSASREEAIAANSNLNVDPELSILLALNALSNARTSEAENALHRAVIADRAHLTLQIPQGTLPGTVAFSLDGNRLATTSGAGADGKVEIWDAATGQELRSFPVADPGAVRFSPDGTRLAVASSDKTGILDATTGRQLKTLSGHTGWVQAVAFSPDGNQLATASEDHTAKIWDLATGQTIATLSGHKDIVSSVSYTPDGKRLLTGSFDNTSIVWDLATGQPVFSLPGMPSAFSPDGARIVTSQAVWDAATGKELFSLRDSPNGAWQVFSPDGKQLIQPDYNGTVTILDAATGEQVLAFPAHTSSILAIAVSPDGEHIATSSQDGTVKVWDISLRGDREWLAIPGAAWNSPGGVTYSRDGTRLATAGPDNTAIVWDAHTGEKIASLAGHTDLVFGMAFSPDGARLATASRDETAMVWDIATGKQLLHLHKAGHGAGNIGGAGFHGLMAVAYSPDGKWLATAGADGTAVLWDAVTGQPLRTFSNAGIGITSLAFSPDGTRLVTGSDAGDASPSATVWELATGKKLLNLPMPARIWAVAYSPDGKRVVTAGFGGAVKIWNALNGEEELPLTGHTGTVSGGEFSPDGKKVATNSADGTVRVWDASTGEQLLLIPGPKGGSAFSPDGTRLAVVDKGILQIYLLNIDDLIALAKSRLSRSLTPEECLQYLQVDICPAGP